jgi:hypothetical protein
VSPSQPADLQWVVFQRTFVVGQAPSGSIQVGADDFVEVFVNGVFAGAVGSVTDINAAVIAQDTGRTLDLTPVLQVGANTIAVAGQNGPASYAGCSGACTYASNPAGVVFAGTLWWQ